VDRKEKCDTPLVFSELIEEILKHNGGGNCTNACALSLQESKKKVEIELKAELM
jgi:hypothetical protein